MIQAIVFSFVAMSGAGMSSPARSPAAAQSCTGVSSAPARQRTSRAGCSGCRPSRRRTESAAARTSMSSTSQAQCTRRARRAGRSAVRPSSGRAPSSAAPGSRGAPAASRRRGVRAPTSSRRARVPQALRHVLLDVGMLQPLLELCKRHAKERRIPLECCLFDVERHGQQSLGRLPHNQKQVGVEPFDHDLVARVRPFLAARAPQLAVDPHLAQRPAGNTTIPLEPGSASAPVTAFRRRESQNQNPVSASSKTAAAATSAMPQPVGSHRTATTMARTRSKGSKMPGVGLEPARPRRGQLILSQPRIASFATPARQG